jgi:hypothetical protein
MNIIQIEVKDFKRVIDMLEALNKKIDERETLRTAKEWITTGEAMTILGLSKKSLYNKRISGELGFSKNGKRIYYLRKDVYARLQDNYQQPFNETGYGYGR